MRLISSVDTQTGIGTWGCSPSSRVDTVSEWHHKQACSMCRSGIWSEPVHKSEFESVVGVRTKKLRLDDGVPAVHKQGRRFRFSLGGARHRKKFLPTPLIFSPRIWPTIFFILLNLTIFFIPEKYMQIKWENRWFHTLNGWHDYQRNNQLTYNFFCYFHVSTSK